MEDDLLSPGTLAELGSFLSGYVGMEFEDIRPLLPMSPNIPSSHLTDVSHSTLLHNQSLYNENLAQMRQTFEWPSDRPTFTPRAIEFTESFGSGIADGDMLDDERFEDVSDDTPSFPSAETPRPNDPSLLHIAPSNKRKQREEVPGINIELPKTVTLIETLADK